MQATWQDLRYGWRMMWKASGFTLITLSHRIIANMAVCENIDPMIALRFK